MKQFAGFGCDVCHIEWRGMWDMYRDVRCPICGQLLHKALPKQAPWWKAILRSLFGGRHG